MDLTGQTYSRKQDSRCWPSLAGVAESCHKMGTDLRLLQGVGELSEPFDDTGGLLGHGLQAQPDPRRKAVRPVAQAW